MSEIFLNISRYLLIFMMLFYVYLSYRICGISITADSSEAQIKVLKKRCLIQNVLTIVMFALCSVSVMYHVGNFRVFAIICLEMLYMIITLVLYRIIYPRCSGLILNNMILLLSIGFLMSFRLAMNNAFKQFVIVIIATVISFVIPKLMQFKRLFVGSRYVFAIMGIILLGITLIMGKTSFGANLSFEIAGIAFQPSEFIKIIYVLFLAGILSKYPNHKGFRYVIISAIFAALHVIILILSNDLGTGLIFFVVYVIMLFIATGKFRYPVAGVVAGSVAGVLAYRYVGHVRTRVIAWLDPWKYIDDKGYQITQSLFAIGMGGLFGMGFFEGAPTKIPVVAKDFVFAAIAEEFGLIYAICIILICFSSFMGIMRVAIRINDKFYKLVASGMGVLYIFQCFLTIGGVTKFIPSTGVTLPFVSYGGSSVLCSIIMFAIIQTVFITDSGSQNIRREKKHEKEQSKEYSKKAPKEQSGEHTKQYQKSGTGEIKTHTKSREKRVNRIR